MSTSATNPQSKEEVIRERVILASQRLFQQYGLAKVTMEDVAKAIGKGKSTLYYYYKSKEEIFTAVMEREIGEVVTEMARAVELASTAEEKMSAFCLTKLRALRKKIALYSIVHTEIASTEIGNQVGFSYVMRQRYLKRESQLLKGILEFGVEAGEFRSLSSSDLDALTFVILSSMHGMEMEMVINYNFDMLEPAISVLTRSLVYGLQR